MSYVRPIRSARIRNRLRISGPVAYIRAGGEWDTPHPGDGPRNHP
jgi:hypothetical protein